MKGAPRRRNTVSQRLRQLDGILGIDHDGHSEWIWAIPAFILVGTVGGFILIGQITGMGAAVAAPIGTLIALVMAGLAIAYMPPVADDPPSDLPPGGHDDSPVLGSPGGPWVVVAHLTPVPAPDPDATTVPSERRALVIAAAGRQPRTLRDLAPRVREPTRVQRNT